jgi:hypothetical protein
MRACKPQTSGAAYAKRIVDQSVSDAPKEATPEKDPAAVALGRKGGPVGGKARAAKLSPEQRAEIARKAAATRWANRG